MWRVAGRMMAVFVGWGIVLIVGLVSGLSAHAVETTATCAAGLSLVGWGLTMARQQRRIEAVVSDGRLAPVVSQERASS